MSIKYKFTLRIIVQKTGITVQYLEITVGGRVQFFCNFFSQALEEQQLEGRWGNYHNKSPITYIKSLGIVKI